MDLSYDITDYDKCVCNFVFSVMILVLAGFGVGVSRVTVLGFCCGLIFQFKFTGHSRLPSLKTIMNKVLVRAVLQEHSACNRRTQNEQQ